MGIEVEIIVPSLGEAVQEATISKWLKKAGDMVAFDDPVVELETDKVTLEVNSTQAGVLKEVRGNAGDNVAIGQVLGVIVTDALVVRETIENLSREDAEVQMEDPPVQRSFPRTINVYGFNLPIAERYFVFSLHKEKILSFVQDHPEFLEGDVENFLPAIQDILPKEDLKILIDGGVLSDRLWYMKLYLMRYLQYRAYEKEIDSALVLNLKEDAVGQLMLGRARKEIAKVAKRNGLNYLIDSWGNDVDAWAMEIICGEVATKNKLIDMDNNNNVGLDFEKSCVKILQDLGYSATLTKQSGDFGCDIIAEKDDIVYAIQCKYTSTRIGVKAVQEVASARRYYKTDMAVVVTNGDFTSAANELASENDVILLHESQLDRMDKLIV